MEQKPNTGSIFADAPLQHLITGKILKDDRFSERICGTR